MKLEIDLAALSHHRRHELFKVLNRFIKRSKESCKSNVQFWTHSATENAEQNPYSQPRSALKLEHAIVEQGVVAQIERDIADLRLFKNDVYDVAVRKFEAENRHLKKRQNEIRHQEGLNSATQQSNRGRGLRCDG